MNSALVFQRELSVVSKLFTNCPLIIAPESVPPARASRYRKAFGVRGTTKTRILLRSLHCYGGQVAPACGGQAFSIVSEGPFPFLNLPFHPGEPQFSFQALRDEVSSLAQRTAHSA